MSVGGEKRERENRHHAKDLKIFQISLDLFFFLHQI